MFDYEKVTRDLNQKHVQQLVQCLKWEGSQEKPVPLPHNFHHQRSGKTSRAPHFISSKHVFHVQAIDLQNLDLY